MKENTFEDLEILMADNVKNALHKSIEYQNALSATDKLYEKLKTGLTREQQELLDQYLVSVSETAAIREKIAYRQGLRDLIKILFQDE